MKLKLTLIKDEFCIKLILYFFFFRRTNELLLTLFSRFVLLLVQPLLLSIQAVLINETG